MAAVVMKVSSPGSQYSISDGPASPNPTPMTEALDNDAIDSRPPTDFVAVTRQLRPIQELLNESADEAMYPSPPINTPEPLSPTPSIIARYQPRGRGFSLISDRLAKLKLDNRRFPSRDSELTSSNRSITLSNAGDDDCDCASEVMSDSGSKETVGVEPDSTSAALSLASLVGAGTVPIALGSPAVNPRIEEYLSFSTKIMDNRPMAPMAESMLVGLMSSGERAGLDREQGRGQGCSQGEAGVLEKSIWAEEVEEGVINACLRLEQLARDEHSKDPRQSLEEYYMERLQRLLGARQRVVPVKVLRDEQCAVQKVRVDEEQAKEGEAETKAGTA